MFFRPLPKFRGGLPVFGVEGEDGQAERLQIFAETFDPHAAREAFLRDLRPVYARYGGLREMRLDLLSTRLLVEHRENRGGVEDA